MTLSPTAFRNVLDALKSMRGDDRSATFSDRVGGSQEWTGTFTFELIHADTGHVDRRVETNQTVDVGENAVLQFIGGIPDNQTVNFDGDGSTTQFDIPFPYHPIQTVNDVSVGGTSQSVPADYAVDYYDGILYFDSAPPSGTGNVTIDLDHYTYPWDWLAVGTDGTAVSAGQTSLQAEDTRISTDSGYYTRSPGSVEITGQWTLGTSQANTTLKEAALFNAPPTAAVDGDMLNRTVISPAIDKTSSFELLVTWVLSM